MSHHRLNEAETAIFKAYMTLYNGICNPGFSGPNCNTIACTDRCLGNNYAYFYTDIPKQARKMKSDAKTPGLFILFQAICFVLNWNSYMSLKSRVINFLLFSSEFHPCLAFKTWKISLLAQGMLTMIHSLRVIFLNNWVYVGCRILNLIAIK